MRCKASRAINLIYWNAPDALDTERKIKSNVEFSLIQVEHTSETQVKQGWTTDEIHK